MRMKMSRVPVDRVFLDRRGPTVTGECEFTVDCGSVYFGAVYAGDGNLLTVDQYFYSEEFSHTTWRRRSPRVLISWTTGISGEDVLLRRGGRRGVAAVPRGGAEGVDPDYYRQKYIGE
jgi:hypothetical protein